jgi:hypothetical protein
MTEEGEAASPIRKLGYRRADGTLGLRDHAQRPGVEGDVGEPQIVDPGLDPHAILALLEVCDGVRDLLPRVGGKRLQVDDRLLIERLLQTRYDRADGGA